MSANRPCLMNKAAKSPTNEWNLVSTCGQRLALALNTEFALAAIARLFRCTAPTLAVPPEPHGGGFKIFLVSLGVGERPYRLQQQYFRNLFGKTWPRAVSSVSESCANHQALHASVSDNDTKSFLQNCASARIDERSNQRPLSAGQQNYRRVL